MRSNLSVVASPVEGHFRSFSHFRFRRPFPSALRPGLGNGSSRGKGGKRRKDRPRAEEEEEWRNGEGGIFSVYGGKLRVVAYLLPNTTVHCTHKRTQQASIIFDSVCSFFPCIFLHSYWGKTFFGYVSVLAFEFTLYSKQKTIILCWIPHQPRSLSIWPRLPPPPQSRKCCHCQGHFSVSPSPLPHSHGLDWDKGRLLHHTATSTNITLSLLRPWHCFCFFCLKWGRKGGGSSLRSLPVSSKGGRGWLQH